MDSHLDPAYLLRRVRLRRMELWLLRQLRFLRLWRLWRLDEATGYSSADTLSALCDVGVRLGADIPFCLHNAPRRAQGVRAYSSPET